MQHYIVLSLMMTFFKGYHLGKTIKKDVELEAEMDQLTYGLDETL